ncbi:MAG TPA: phenylalanine--tRNA ligase subunit alpha [Chthoniobacterales bacterium]|nr:phenylalanine--tRNA ligase subunit alpha [Chthoniobacterales bacterium]
MEAQIESLHAEALAAINAADTSTALDAARVKYMGRAGAIPLLSEGMRTVAKEDKARVGKALNALRTDVTAALEAREYALAHAADTAALSQIDVTLPGIAPLRGSIHPLTQLLDKAVRIFRRMGFAIAEGPDIETEWHCFDALNTPPHHPARNEQDTFYMPDGRLLRTHTSTVQIRTMENQPPPVRIIAPGAAYRRDEVDATHLAQFTQMEGLYVAEKVSVADLKGTIEFFFRELFGEGTAIRFRPHFFPFTEPSFEIDIQTASLGGKWMELAGCGMVDPAVFEQICSRRLDRVYDPDKVSGFAFGFGLDRLAMNLTGIPDIRMLVENDLRFLKQF